MERRVVRRYQISRTPIIAWSAVMLLLIAGIVISFIVFLIQDLGADPNEKQLSVLDAGEELFPGQVLPGDLAAAAVLKRHQERTGIVTKPNPEDIVTELVLVDTIVPETVEVDESYYTDAVFIGDSISLGMRTNIRQISSSISPNQFICEKNISVSSILSNQKVFSGKTQTLWEAMQAQVPNPGKIYVLLGTNGLPWYDNADQIEMYGQLIDQLKAKYPNAILYVQSLTPKRQISDYDSKFDSAKINDFNDQLLLLAQEKDVYYLDVQTALKDENGYLKEEYSTSEGLHPVAKGHAAMLDYYKTHVVEKDGTAEVIVESTNRRGS